MISRVSKLSTQITRTYCYKSKRTIEEVLSKWQECFQKNHIPEHVCSSELITAHALGRKTLHGVSKDDVLSESQEAWVNEMCKKRLKRVPVQYIIGEWDFLSLTLKMKPPVFIPRPETELESLKAQSNLRQKELVSLVYEGIVRSGNDSSAPSLLDIGTGSGAILIALLDLLPKARGVGVDRIPEACCLAAENAGLIGVQNRLRIFHTDLADENKDWAKLTESCGEFDVIVSNPPYIPAGNMGDLDPEITRYEDHNALFSGDDGMDFTRLILGHAQQLLKPSGSLWLEVDLSHPGLVRRYVQEHDVGLTYVRTHLDISNRERFCHLVKRAE